MSKSTTAEADHQTSWQPPADVLHQLLLNAILKNNPIPAAYRIRYVANFYVGPLVAQMEKSFKLTRPEWIVLFCLTRQPRLNAQQISSVTGRAQTRITGAVPVMLATSAAWASTSPISNAFCSPVEALLAGIAFSL